eukprot:jgi/Mesen1/977/ME000012S00528
MAGVAQASSALHLLTLGLSARNAVGQQDASSMSSRHCQGNISQLSQSVPQHTRRQQSVGGARAAGFDISKLLGGRGLGAGEQSLRTPEGQKSLFPDTRPKEEAAKKEKLQDLDPNEMPSGFDKELNGLTGGFPGGEVGLKTFVKKFPPPSKLSRELQQARKEYDTRARPADVAPPLLMPGMTVRVNDTRSMYHNYTGIVQRVTDGRVGVLFEGGNWDKLIAFELAALVRTQKGPPGSNPKSAILELES